MVSSVKATGGMVVLDLIAIAIEKPSVLPGHSVLTV